MVEGFEDQAATPKAEDRNTLVSKHNGTDMVGKLAQRRHIGAPLKGVHVDTWDSHHVPTAWLLALSLPPPHRVGGCMGGGAAT